MKKLNLLVGLAILLATFKGFSQDSTKVLFHFPKAQINTIGFYVAPEYQFGQLKNEFTSIGGVSGMILINNKFGIGASMAQSLDRTFSPTGITPLYLHTAVGGLKMEYVCYPQSAVHFSFNLLLGGGMASADSSKYFDRRNVADFDHSGMDRQNHIDNQGIRSNFFIAQPGAQIEANIFKYVKLFAGVNYRFAVQGNSSNSLLPTSTLQGLSANVGLKIGLFDYQIHKKE
jgi:hypothetical protein